MTETTIDRDGVALAVEEAGDEAGPPVVLLHGLTATRRYVVMGSRSLERDGLRVVGFDARGHGGSSPAPSPHAYDYDAMIGDLLAVLDGLRIERAVLAGASMGAHSALAFALAHPQRVAGLAVVTPAYDPQTHDDPARLERWDALAGGLRAGGVDGFLAAYGEPAVPEKWVHTARTVIRQRLAQHAHPEAVADALSAVPRSRPFGELGELGSIAAPTVVVASRDETDPEHPFALAHAYGDALPGARVRCEEEGASPLAWQGGQLSRVIASVAKETET